MLSHHTVQWVLEWQKISKLTLQFSIIGCNAAPMEGIRNVLKILVGKPEDKGPLRKHVRRLNGKLKMCLQDMQFEGIK